MKLARARADQIRIRFTVQISKLAQCKLTCESESISHCEFLIRCELASGIVQSIYVVYFQVVHASSSGINATALLFLESFSGWAMSSSAILVRLDSGHWQECLSNDQCQRFLPVRNRVARLRIDLRIILHQGSCFDEVEFDGPRCSSFKLSEATESSVDLRLICYPLQPPSPF